MTPQQIKAQFAQAQQLIKAGQAEHAMTLLKTLLLPTGGAPEVQFQIARAAELLGDTPAQARALDRALERRPDEPAILQAAIRTHARLGDDARVLALHDALIAGDPKAIKPRADKAMYLQQTGDFDAAEKLLRALLRQAPQETELYRMLSTGLTFRPGDPLLKPMRRLWTDPRLNDHGRMQLGFALAKASEDLGDRDKVFDYLDAANAAQARLAPGDPAERQAEWEAMRDAQDTGSHAAEGAPLPVTPVFVTGMPRSGTTLVEQIIGAHSQARAGGELGHALREAARLFGHGADMIPLGEIPQARLDKWAEGYCRLVRRDTGADGGVVTDKSIQSQLIFGLIARGLPGARIIVVHRDPRDMALSIYRNHFALGTHRYATDLAQIAEAIKLFRRAVAHWKDRLPGRIHEVRYDDLVSDPEPQARALVAAAGLDWEDACLDFHKSRSGVKTLSLMQVRQPIHSGRRAAWQKYEAELAPFIEAWGDEAWD